MPISEIVLDESILQANNVRLDPFDKWMVKSNILTAREQGKKNIVDTLRRNAYPRIAKAVELLAPED